MKVMQAAMFAAGFEATKKKLGRLPTDKEIAKEIGWSLKNVVAARKALEDLPL